MINFILDPENMLEENLAMLEGLSRPNREGRSIISEYELGDYIEQNHVTLSTKALYQMLHNGKEREEGEGIGMDVIADIPAEEDETAEGDLSEVEITSLSVETLGKAANTAVNSDPASHRAIIRHSLTWNAEKNETHDIEAVCNKKLCTGEVQHYHDTDNC